MSKLAVIICNYNKEDYIVNCIKSVRKSSFRNLDLYVVDNASMDNSVEMINKNFKNEINLIINKENLGGSGGFNTGLKEVIDKGYDYIMLLDNDVILHEDAISELVKFLENNKEYGMVGSLILSIDNPDVIQELGADIDFQNYTINPFFKGGNKEGAPELIECDYVPACSLIVRGEALKKVGLMNEENFIYWDDIEWGYKFKLNGYKVGAYSKSIVWHKMGAATKENTFATYYFWRNRIKFFLNYLEESKVQDFCRKIFNNVFNAIFMCNYQGKYSQAITIMEAIEDALNGELGKGKSARIKKIEKLDDKLKQILESINIVNVVNKTGSLEDINKVNNLLKQYNINNVNNNLPDRKFEVYRHILDVENFDENVIYIDGFFNIAYTKDDKIKLESKNSVYELAQNIYYPFLLNKAYEYIESRKMNE